MGDVCDLCEYLYFCEQLSRVEYDETRIAVIHIFYCIFGCSKRPSWQMLNSTFKGLKPYTDVVYPWREEYRELMKDWVLEDVQYNYGIFGEE